MRLIVSIRKMLQGYQSDRASTIKVQLCLAPLGISLLPLLGIAALMAYFQEHDQMIAMRITNILGIPVILANLPIAGLGLAIALVIVGVVGVLEIAVSFIQSEVVWRYFR